MSKLDFIRYPNCRLVFILREFVGLIWLATVFRRLTANYGNFENRITSMSEGTTIVPSPIMDLAVEHWFVLYLIVISIEIVSSLSLITGTFARGGALLASINGFLIGMAGIGISLVDLLIPWSVSFITFYLFLFSHPGLCKGLDEYLQSVDLPKFLKDLI